MWGHIKKTRKQKPRKSWLLSNSLIRYGAAVYLKPIYDKEDLNMEKKNKKYCYPSNTSEQYAKGDFWLSIKKLY